MHLLIKSVVQCTMYMYHSRSPLLNLFSFCFRCGKTTQIPQFILDSYLDGEQGAECNIVCTQPRRISAMSVAERVAEERAEKLGDIVGYKIRLESKQARGHFLISVTPLIYMGWYNACYKKHMK